jgi:two-component system NtrC family response regulator
LIVDDDEELRTQLKWALRQDYEVCEAEDRAGALGMLRQYTPAAVILDLGLPPRPSVPAEGFLTLAAMRDWDPLIKVVVLTAQEEKTVALEAIDQGAHDFLCKPVGVRELKVLLDRAVRVYALEQENRELWHRIEAKPFAGILGASAQMQSVFSAIRKVAATDAPVLLIGESGTGKELAARAIHEVSPRREGAFVAINCGAIPETLLESELFGHEKGAFTGAHIQRKGRVEMARGGTLFLDEVADLTLPLQAKLLRFLQDQQIERIGGRESISVDARVMAATNSDLDQAIEDGRFREDLYYRIGVVVIPMPPLRERDGDVLLLARYLLHKFGKEYGKKIEGFSR